MKYLNDLKNAFDLQVRKQFSKNKEMTNLKFDENHLPYIDVGDNAVIRMEKEDPPEWALEKARTELRETPEIIQSAIKELRELIQSKFGIFSKIKHFKPLLLLFLRRRTFASTTG